MSSELVGPKVPVAITIAVDPGTEVLGVITMQYRDGALTAVSQPVKGRHLPERTPALLRWLADALEIDMLAEVPDALG